MQSHTIMANVQNTKTSVVTYKDSLGKDYINLRLSKEKIPIHYFKNIKTDVCFDGECRLLDIDIYWNIPGRYLGFELPKEEFLSKYDHEPFSEDEYKRLHMLLADILLPFDNISFDELIAEPDAETEEIDGVSGATTQDVAKIVIKGAAFTTYKLWNIIYGPTMKFVSNLTESQLTADLISLILKSPDINDRTWALDRITPSMKLNKKLTTSLLELISSSDYFMAYAAMNAIDTAHLNAAELQLGLLTAYKTESHSIKKMILEKLIESSYLNEDVVRGSRSLLEGLNGQQLDGFLKLYTIHEVIDLETCKAIAKIIQNKNNYISQKAYKFLKVLKIENAVILESIKRYEDKK